MTLYPKNPDQTKPLSLNRLTSTFRRPQYLVAGGGQRLVEIGDDVVFMLDADGKPDGFRGDTGLALVGLRHLTMGR